MTNPGTYADIDVTLNDYVATVTIQRPPHNFFDFNLICSIADAFEDLDKNNDCRAIVLTAEGKSFCAGANFGGDDAINKDDDAKPEENAFRRRSGRLYGEAVRLFKAKKPVVCAVQGAAIGGGLGLALVGDFRVTCPEARFSANFSRLGFHPGFGLTHTLPALIGQQKAHLMFYTGRRIKAEQAVEWGLADILVPKEDLLPTATALAREIAGSAPLAVQSIRETVRQGLADRVQAATDRELQEQEWLLKTSDAKEGIKATAERREPNFSAK
ncbi:MAG: enoyl-CoA hydratase/isomerase family protein [Gammaproteobacteria bacterium]|nr:MAG: enoyl-CoA hydratase/isomerase family protein [Gammaproteobacteria bacterium]RLA44946.1 MAG: enoyl-CoA hydratase/isomerase family protein [Gammaproteobacteria bacterium]